MSAMTRGMSLTAGVVAVLLSAISVLTACDRLSSRAAQSPVLNSAKPSATGLRSNGPTAGAQHDAALPPPVKPEWLTKADLERAVKALGNDADKQNAFVSELDFFVLMSADSAGETRSRHDAVAAGVLLVKYSLHRFFYPVSFDKTQHPADDPDFYRTLVMFERRAGLKVDGKFTVGESQRLAFLASLEGEPEITAGPKLVHGSATYAMAEGTLVIQGDRIANPVNHVEIRCVRDDSGCDLFMAEVSLPEEHRSNLGSPQLTTYTEHYDITEWNRDELRARTATSCRQIVLTLNWVTDQVHTVATDLSKEGCPSIGRLNKPRLVTLEDGFTTTKKFYESRRELLRGVSDSPLERVRSLYSLTQPAP